MLKEISWKEYWEFVLLLTTLYYIFVFFFLYKKEIALIIEGKTNDQTMPEVESSFSSAQSCNNTPSSTTQTSLFEEDAIKVSANIHSDNEDEIINENENDLHEINLIPYAHELANEIKQLFQKAEEKKYVKEELLFSLQEIIKAYQQLKGTSYQRDINDLIVTHCETYCSIHLSAGEVATVWLN